MKKTMIMATLALMIATPASADRKAFDFNGYAINFPVGTMPQECFGRGNSGLSKREARNKSGAVKSYMRCLRGNERICNYGSSVAEYSSKACGNFMTFAGMIHNYNAYDGRRHYVSDWMFEKYRPYIGSQMDILEAMSNRKRGRYDAERKEKALKQFQRIASSSAFSSSTRNLARKDAGVLRREIESKKTADAKRKIRQMKQRELEQRPIRQACFTKYNLSKAKFEKFEQNSGIEDWPKDEALVANPYVYKGKTIGILTVFRKMISEHDASFAKNPFGLGTEAHVSGVPSTKFQKQEAFLLAGKVLGKKDSVLSLEYLDVISCGSSMVCEDILYFAKIDQIKEKIKKRRSSGNSARGQNSVFKMIFGEAKEDTNCAIELLK